MIAFFVIIIVGSIFLGIASSVMESRRRKPSYETLFFNSPEENSTSSLSAFQSLLINGGLVLLVLLSYWLCL